MSRLRAAHVVAELSRRLVVDEPMAVPVRRELVARGGDAAHERGNRSATQPSTKNVALTWWSVEDREQSLGVRDDAAGTSVPRLAAARRRRRR